MEVTRLTNYEAEYISLWGELYENRGQNEVLGKIWGLLTLKADAPEEGLDQVKISKLLNRSVSTVSRHLKTLTNMQIISHKDDDVRKYYVSKNFKEISNLRFYASVNEYREAINELSDIKNSMSQKEVLENQSLIDTINLTENVLNKISEIFLNVLKGK